MTRVTLVVLAAFLSAAGICTAADAPVSAAASKPAAKILPEEQARIAKILALAGNHAASADDVAFLAEELKNSSPLVRAHAAHALGEFGAAAKPAVQALVAAAADADPAVRRAASHAVLRLHPGPAVTLPLAKKLLRDADPAVRMRFLLSLVDLGKEAVPGLRAALKDDEMAKYACLVLSEIGPDADAAAPELLDRLKTETHPEVRQQVILALGAIRAVDAVPALIGVVENEKDVDRAAAAFSLGRIGPAAKAAVPTLTKTLDDADPVLKTVSAWALAKIAPDNAQLKDKCVDLLIESLLSKDPLARRAAFRGLADLRPGPARVMPTVKRILEGADKEAAADALQAMASFGERTVPALINALKLPEYRPLVASILAAIGPAAKEAVGPLADVAKTDASEDARREALLALGAIGPAAEAAVPAAAAALTDSDDRVILAACYALKKIGPAAKDAIPALKILAGDKDATLQKAAEKAIQAIERQ